MKKPTPLFMYEKGNVIYGTTTKISGKLLYNDTGIKGEKITININGKEYNAISGGYGYFTINHTANNVGINTVKYIFGGSSKYLASNNNTTFYVPKISTKITVENLLDTILGNDVIISGKCTDSNNKPMTNEIVTINIDGYDYDVLTNNQGVYNYTYKTNNLGIHTLKVTYYGNTLYSSTSKTINFNIIEISTKIIIENVDNVQYSDNTRISG